MTSYCSPNFCTFKQRLKKKNSAVLSRGFYSNCNLTLCDGVTRLLFLSNTRLKVLSGKKKQLYDYDPSKRHMTRQSVECQEPLAEGQQLSRPASL